MNKDTSYLEVATVAAKMETEGDYTQATFLWNTAQSLAKNATNEAWCQTRSELCKRKKYSAFVPQ